MVPAVGLILAVTAFSLLSVCNGATEISPNVNFTDYYTRQRRLCRNATVEITVSATVTEDTIRLLQLTWDTEDFFPGDYVGIYTEDPKENNESIPEFTVEVTTGAGWVTTDIQETRDSWSLTFHPECKEYWAAYKTNTTDEVIASSCLKTEPTWMKENQPVIGNLTLVNSFIPGTHDSGSYVLSIDPYVENRWMKYVYTQDEDILSQLIYGARFLDLRIGYYAKDTEPWWINHSFIRIRPLSIVLNDIKEFIKNTEEIAIVDFHHFPVGFSTGDVYETHVKLIEYIEEQLDEYLAPSSLGWGATLNTIWAGGKQRVVLSYNYQPLYYHKGIVWPAVKQQWGDVNNLPDLLSYLESIFNKPPSDAWSAMAELTPTKLDVIMDRLEGLRDMADMVNGNITDRLRNRWGVKCNIAAVDFIRSTGIVRAAKAWNKRRAVGQMCDSR